MSAGDLWDLDFPSPRHDARCAVWTSSNPDAGCSRLDDCRDDQGRTERPHLVSDPGSTAARLDAIEPVELPCDEEAS